MPPEAIKRSYKYFIDEMEVYIGHSTNLKIEDGKIKFNNADGAKIVLKTPAVTIPAKGGRGLYDVLHYTTPERKMEVIVNRDGVSLKNEIDLRAEIKELTLSQLADLSKFVAEQISKRLAAESSKSPSMINPCGEVYFKSSNDSICDLSF